MNLHQAEQIAQNIIASLVPHCEPGRIHIAGSVRRKKAEVKDIEVVCLPVRTWQFDMFDNVTGVIRSKGFVDAVEGLGEVIKGNPNTGRYCQIRIPAGDNINIDLFMPEPYDYFRQLAIRTGSAEYAQKVIATGWRKIGWVGTKDGLRLEAECMYKELSGGKKQWNCGLKDPTLPPVWKSEESFFDWLGVPWTEPEKR